MTGASGMFEPIGSTSSASQCTARSVSTRASWRPILPVPEDAPAPPAAHPKRGKPSSTWTYRDEEGRALGLVTRFDEPEGGKAILPLTWCRHEGDGREEWRWRLWDVPRPLYGIDGLAARLEAPVIVAEGEKAADAAAQLLPDHVAMTPPNGSRAAGKADWAPLAGRRVTIWPDADEAGRGFAEDVASALMAVGAEVTVIEPPAGVKPGWDAANALAEGWDTAPALALVKAATVVARPAPDGSVSEENEKEDGSARRRRGLAQHDVLVGLTREPGVELWHTPSNEPWASVPVLGHIEHCPIRSKAGAFRRWLAGHYYAGTGGAPGGQAMEDALRVVEVLAIEGPEYPIFTRIGADAGRVYLDLGDAAWRVVEIGPEGWHVQSRPLVKFLRTAAMRALPEPEAGESVDVLRSLLNTATEADFKMVIGWLVGAFRPRGPYAMLILSGEQGTAKSTLATILRDLIDPRDGGLRALPRDERDLAVAAYNSWVLAYDNLSGISGWLSDAFCRLSTGGGFATRELHSDREEVVITAQLPLILNGITDLAARPDLADRAVAVALRPIAREDRRPQSRIDADVARVRPEALGAILDAVSSALRNAGTVHLDAYERMADFMEWVTAAEEGLGWEPGAFAAAYRANREETVEVSIENDPVAAAVVRALEKEGTLDGPASEIMPIIEREVSDRVKASRIWPNSPSRFGAALMRCAPMLRAAGYAVEHTHSGGKRWTIRKTGS